MSDENIRIELDNGSTIEVPPQRVRFQRTPQEIVDDVAAQSISQAAYRPSGRRGSGIGLGQQFLHEFYEESVDTAPPAFTASELERIIREQLENAQNVRPSPREAARPSDPNHVTLSFEGVTMTIRRYDGHPFRRINYKDDELDAFVEKLFEKAMQEKMFSIEKIEKFIENMYDQELKPPYSGIIGTLIRKLASKMSESSPHFVHNNFLENPRIENVHEDYFKLLSEGKDTSHYFIDQCILFSTTSGPVIIPVFTMMPVRSFTEKEKFRLLSNLTSFMEDSDGQFLYSMDKNGQLNYTFTKNSHITSMMVLPTGSAMKYFHSGYQPTPLPNRSL